MEKAMRDGQDATARAREQLMQLDVDLQEMQGEKSVKVMELMKRDEEITAFLDSYDQSQRKMVEDSAAIEQSILDLLDRISKVWPGGCWCAWGGLWIRSVISCMHACCYCCR